MSGDIDSIPDGYVGLIAAVHEICCKQYGDFFWDGPDSSDSRNKIKKAQSLLLDALAEQKLVAPADAPNREKVPFDYWTLKLFQSPLRGIKGLG